MKIIGRIDLSLIHQRDWLIQTLIDIHKYNKPYLIYAIQIHFGFNAIFHSFYISFSSSLEKREDVCYSSMNSSSCSSSSRSSSNSCSSSRSAGNGFFDQFSDIICFGKSKCRFAILKILLISIKVYMTFMQIHINMIKKKRKV